jgi:hypothetical protein
VPVRQGKEARLTESELTLLIGAISWVTANVVALVRLRRR